MKYNLLTSVVEKPEKGVKVDTIANDSLTEICPSLDISSNCKENGAEENGK